MEDVAVYGYITPLKMKIVLALALSDSVVRDTEVTTVSTACSPSMVQSISICTVIQSIAYGLLLFRLKSILKIGHSN